VGQFAQPRPDAPHQYARRTLHIAPGLEQKPCKLHTHVWKLPTEPHGTPSQRLACKSLTPTLFSWNGSKPVRQEHRTERIAVSAAQNSQTQMPLSTKCSHNKNTIESLRMPSAARVLGQQRVRPHARKEE